MVMVSVMGMHRFCIYMTVSMGFLYMMFMRMGMLMGFQGFMTMLIMMFPMILAVRISIMPMQIFHIVIVIFMVLIQHHIKITGIDPGFYHTADLYVETFYRQTFKSSHQFFLICTQIQKSRNCHIPADPGGTLQI